MLQQMVGPAMWYRQRSPTSSTHAIPPLVSWFSGLVVGAFSSVTHPSVISRTARASG